MILEYRCFLYEPPQPNQGLPERPTQAMFKSKKVALEWADKVLARAVEGSEVWLYEIREFKIDTLKKGNMEKE